MVRGKRGQPTRYYLVALNYLHRPTHTIGIYTTRKDAERAAKERRLTVAK
jgi:hypothetical protein